MFTVPKDYADASHYAAVLATLDAQQACTNAEHAAVRDNRLFYREFARRFALRAEHYLKTSYVGKSPCHDVRREISRERIIQACYSVLDRLDKIS